MSVVVDVDVIINAPMLKTDAGPLIDRWLDDVKASYGAEGLSEVSFWMNQFFRDPTPFYETQVIQENVGRDRVIHDRGIIYGPWLAGESTRNAATSFKGYTHWRRTVQHLEEEEGPQIVARLFPELEQRLLNR